MADFNLSEKMRGLVEKSGDVVGLDTPHCTLWKADHDNCEGCDCALGCGKTVHLMLVMMIPMMYKPKNYDDFSQMQNRIQELMDKTMKAKTVEELHLVPSQ